MCDQIETEDQAEKCADYGYTCPHCRPPDELPPHLLRKLTLFLLHLEVFLIFYITIILVCNHPVK